MLVTCALLAAHMLAGGGLPERDASGKPALRSESAIVRLVDSGEIVLEKNPDFLRPIASVTKLLSGLLLANQQTQREQLVTITEEDKDRLKWSRSHLSVNLSMAWLELLRAGVGASDNRAIYAAVRAIEPRADFVARMNA